MNERAILADTAEFCCEVDGAPVMDVIAFHGIEAISYPFRFTADVVMEEDWTDAEAFLGASTLLTVEGPAAPRFIHGMLDTVVYVGRKGQYNQYRLEVAPLLWYLSYTQQSRIFQDMTTPEILAEVLEAGGVPSDRYRMALTREYAPRNYCVQYRETDLNFLHRLMEDEGIFYFFEHADDGHTLVIADDSVVHVDLPDAPLLPFREPSGLVGAEQSVASFDYQQRISPDRVVLKDYSYKQPDLDVSGDKQGSRFPNLEVYDFPGEFVTPELGEVFAEIRYEASEALRWIGRGGSDCRNLTPGYLFSLDQHPDANCNRVYLVTRVRHRGVQPQGLGALAGPVKKAGYSNDFDVIPAEVTFRPQRRTRRPSIPGVQTATVMGPEGEEIYTDDDGRIKVMFHWDRAGDVSPENRSCWIRVAQPWAGNQFGVVFVPRVGQEVVVQFLEGDPNRPLVTGVVYNRRNPAPYGSPESNTASTIKTNSTPGGGGFNELRFEDAKGEEEVYLHAERDLNEVVRNDHNTHVDGRRFQHVVGDKVVQVDGELKRTVTKDTTLLVKEGDRKTFLEQGMDALELQKGHRYVRVEEGDLQTYVGGDASLEVVGTQKIEVKGDRKVKIGEGDLMIQTGHGSVTIEARGNMRQSSESDVDLSANASLRVGALKEIVLSVGGSKITVNNAGITISAPKITSSAAGVHQIQGSVVKLN